MHQELMLKMISVVPKDVLISMLLERIKEYRINPTEESEQLMLSACSMLLQKHFVDKEGVEEITKQFDLHRSIEKQFNQKN